MKKKLLFSFVFVLAFVIQGFAQRTVSGTVTDDKAQPVIGATVFVKGNTKMGAVTDADGKYSINEVPNGAILVVKAVDFKDKEINSGSQSVVNFSLELDEIETVQVISTGYGEVDSRSFTGSAGKVGNKEIENVPIQSFDQVLQGRTPGILVQGSSGQPGAGASVLIRGRGSINSDTEPLYIVDGAQVDPTFFGTFNQNDFESITVLKDGPAVAIYGSRGANGVIVVTTKKGIKNKNLFSYDFQYGMAIPDYSRFLQTLNSREKIQVEQEVGVGYSNDVSDAELDVLKNTFTDWKRVILKPARTMQHNLNASGGSDKLRYFISLNYYDQEGTVAKSFLKRYSGRLNLDYIDKNFSFTFNNFVSFANASRTAENDATITSPLNGIYWSNPYETVYDPTHITGYNVFDSSPFSFRQPNVVEELELTTDRTDYVKAFPTLSAEYNFPNIPGLSIRTRQSADIDVSEASSLDIHPSSIAVLGEPFTVDGTLTGTGGRFNRQSRRRIQYTGTTSISYTKDLNENNSFRISLFQEIVQRNLKTFGFSGYGLNGSLLNEAGITKGSVDNPQYIADLNGLTTNNGLFSVFLDGSYTFKKKYSFSANIRRDGSSKLLKENRYVTTYSVGANWMISDEDFIKNTKVSLLRARLSYATTANQNLIAGGAIRNDFPAYELFNNATYNGLISLTQANLADPTITWERRNKFNFGTDFGFFDNRLTGSFNLYNDKTINLFLDKQLSRTTGFAVQIGNVGELRNRGVELELNYDLLRVGDFVWNIGGNVTYNQNKILKLLPDTDEILVGTTLINKVGYPVNSLYLIRYAGVNPANGDALFYDSNGNITPYKDAKALNIYKPRDPRVFGGFTSAFKYKDFSLSAFFSYMAGHALYNNELNNIENPDYITDGFARSSLRRWMEPGDITDFPRMATKDGRLTQVTYTENGGATTRNMEDASFIRLRNLQVSYNLPTKWISKAKIQNVRLFAVGQNLLTFTRWTGVDPERGQGALGALYPAMRIYTVGASVTF